MLDCLAEHGSNPQEGEGVCRQTLECGEQHVVDDGRQRVDVWMARKLECKERVAVAGVRDTGGMGCVERWIGRAHELGDVSFR